MQAPRFWYRAQPNAVAYALRPLSALYTAGTARKLATGARAKLGVPVVCVGNLTAGGTGKTPTVIALWEILAGLGATPHILSRGSMSRVNLKLFYFFLHPFQPNFICFCICESFVC